MITSSSKPSLPVITLDNDEKWDCHQCGFCCRGSLIPLSRDDLTRLQSQKWGEQPEFQGRSAITVRYPGAESSFRLAHQADGSCVFLSESGGCRIHSKFGGQAKPTVCQTFPFQLIPHEQKAVLTVRLACPSAAASLGSPATNQLPFIKQLVRDGRLKADPIAPPTLKTGELRDWKTVSKVLASVAGLLQDQRYPPVRRLVHALQFASLLEAAKTKNLNDLQIVELVQTLANLAPEESKLLFEDRREPRSYAKIMFRFMAIDCARLHPLCRHQSKWAARFQLMETAFKVVRGTGDSPVIGQVFDKINFADLERPLGVLSSEVYRPLTRLIETTSASYLYAIADRREWSVVESIRGLAILFPVGLWLMRWLAHGRDPAVQDMVNIVVALDRSQGYAPLAGGIHRWRLSALSAHAELERLVVWYAR